MSGKLSEPPKRVRSPNYLTCPAANKNKNIFISTNRFSTITVPVEDIQIIVDRNDHSPKSNLAKPPNPSQILIQTELNFNSFTTKIIRLTQLTGFESNVCTKILKL